MNFLCLFSNFLCLGVFESNLLDCLKKGANNTSEQYYLFEMRYVITHAELQNKVKKSHISINSLMCNLNLIDKPIEFIFLKEIDFNLFYLLYYP